MQCFFAIKRSCEATHSSSDHHSQLLQDISSIEKNVPEKRESWRRILHSILPTRVMRDWKLLKTNWSPCFSICRNECLFYKDTSTDTDMHELSNFGWQHRLAESVEDANDLFYPASCSKSRNAILYTRT